MKRLALGVVCCALIGIPIGCSSENGEQTGGSGGMAGAGGAAGMGGDAGTGGAGGVDGTITLTATVTEAPSLDADMFTGPPLEGVELCETDTTNCATTGADGTASIMIAASQEFSFTLSKEGYAPYLAGDVSDVPVLSVGNYPMISDALMEAESERLTFEWPSNTTGLVGLAVFPLRAGVMWEIDDEGAIGYYHDADGVAQTDLTATTDSGRGGFYEASEGVREVDFGGAIPTCTVRTAWPTETVNRIRVPVQAGHISFGSMDCDEL